MIATTTTTPRATFTIYRDEPSPPQPKRKAATTKSNPPTSPITNRIGPVYMNEKENINPITGHLPTIEQKLAKKRKTDKVLTAKILLSTKSLKETQPEPKKRRIILKTKTRSDKEKKVLALKKDRSERVRKATDLPRVEEEQAEEVEDKEKVAQALVDARCYELTVMPLADVSDAYSPSAAAEGETKGEGEKAIKPSSKSEVSAPSNLASTSKSAHEHEPSSPVRPLTSSSAFSTPERKRIYSAFTFESPSPASKRFAAHSRASSVERFIDLQFDPTGILDRAL